MSGIAKIILTIPGATLFWLLLAIFLLMIFKLFAEIIIASPKINPVDIQASYIRAVFTVIGFLLATIIFIYGLSRIGVSLAPLLAGVGIGGFAIAIAARPTLENIIGSFMIFADKPFKVGQRIKVTNYDGTVEEIGLRSTKIRLLNGNLTSIPNEKMVTLEIENIARRPYIRRTFNICITYGTPPDKIIRAVKLLGEILSVPSKTELEISDPGDKNSRTSIIESSEEKPHPNEAINKPDFPPRIFFSDFNADSLNIYVSYWYHPPEWWEYNEHAHWINIQIKERFNAEGIEFAFPTQTIHLADEGSDQK
jgi:MscS family membrane protein